jgi:hypothetical protein
VSADKEPITFPHCDARIVHAPGECSYCDESGLQYVRENWGINFTGHNDEDKLPCPADLARSKESLNSWGGNRPNPTLDSVAKVLVSRHGESEE